MADPVDEPSVSGGDNEESFERFTAFVERSLQIDAPASASSLKLSPGQSEIKIFYFNDRSSPIRLHYSRQAEIEAVWLEANPSAGKFPGVSCSYHVQTQSSKKKEKKAYATYMARMEGSLVDSQKKKDAELRKWDEYREQEKAYDNCTRLARESVPVVRKKCLKCGTEQVCKSAKTGRCNVPSCRAVGCLEMKY